MYVYLQSFLEMLKWHVIIHESWMHVLVLLFFFLNKSYCVSLCIHFLRPSWVPWSLPVRSWLRRRRAGPQGSHSTPLSNSTLTWLSWMGTYHGTTLTTSSAACSHKCRCHLCLFARLCFCVCVYVHGLLRWDRLTRFWKRLCCQAVHWCTDCLCPTATKRTARLRSQTSRPGGTRARERQKAEEGTEMIVFN